MSNEWDIERAIDAMTASGLSRRTLMRRAGAGAMSLGVIGFLAACGDDGGSADSAKTIPKGEIAKNMTFANWSYYMDVKGKSHPTLDQFQDKYGTKVKYVEEINDNVEFFGKVRQQYAAGQLGRPRPARRDRLDGQPDEAARLRPEARQVGDAERREEHRACRRQPRVRPQA